MRASLFLSSTTLAAATLGLLLAPAISLAQTIDAAGAEQLEAQVPALFDHLLQSAPHVTYRFDGTVEALPSDDGYSLAIPQVTLTGRGNAEVTVPPMVATVTPQDNGWQRAEWDFNSPIIVTNRDGSDERAVIRFDSTDNEVTIAPEYRMALEADIVVDDIAVTVEGRNGSITADGLELVIESEPSGAGPNSYDSRTEGVLDALTINLPDEEVHITVGGVDMFGETQRQRLDLFAELQDRLQGIDPESDAFLATYVAIVREYADEKWIGDTSYTMVVDDVAFDIEGQSGSLGLLRLAFEAEELDAPVSSLAFALDVEDVQSPDAPTNIEPVMPTHVTLDLRAVDAPFEALANAVYEVVGPPPSDEELFGPKGRRAGVGPANPLSGFENLDPMEFLNILIASDAQVLLEELFIEAPIGYVAGDGVIEPNANAAFQVVADFELTIAGLPEMIAYAQNLGGNAMQMAGFASAIAAMGRDDTDDDGTDVKVFEVEVTESGSVLLNGNDMSAMMGLFP